MAEKFLSIKGFCRYEEKIKRSTFIGSASVVFSEIEAKEFIKNIAKEFKNATHNCWAYKVAGKVAYSDAGEPSGTAGRPIFGAIEKLNLDNIVVVVTRFFGGIKLGVRGLIDAYFGIALKTLKLGGIVLYVSNYKITLSMEYPVFDRFIKSSSKLELDLNTHDFQFAEVIRGFIYVPERSLKEFESMVSNLKKYGNIEYSISEKLYIPGKMEVQ